MEAGAKCIFCGCDGPLTDAHVFRRDWIARLFPTMEMFRHVRHAYLPGHEDSSVWPVPWADLKVKDVCQPCNGGWMNDLDHSAEDAFATRAAMGLDVKVARVADKRLVARWCSLIAVLLDRLSAQPRLGEDAHAAVHRGDVPDGAQIWLVHTEPRVDQQPHVFSSAKDLELVEHGTPQGYAFFVTYGVGHLIVQVYMPIQRTASDVEIRRIVNRALVRQLWPDLLLPLVWPPPQWLPGDQLTAFCDSFQRFHPLSS